MHRAGDAVQQNLASLQMQKDFGDGEPFRNNMIQTDPLLEININKYIINKYAYLSNVTPTNVVQYFYSSKWDNLVSRYKHEWENGQYAHRIFTNRSQKKEDVISTHCIEQNGTDNWGPNNLSVGGMEDAPNKTYPIHLWEY